MTEQMKDQLGRAYLKILKRHAPSVDAIGLSERLIEAAELIHDINSENEGIADLPVDLQSLGEPERTIPYRERGAFTEPRDEPRSQPPDRVTLPPPAKNAVVPQRPAQAKSLLTLPGDPDFNAGKPADINGKKIISASEIRRPTRRPSNLPETPMWGESDLIQNIIDNTPEELTIETENREGRPVTLVVKRNTHNQAGLGTIILAYKHPAVSETDGFLTAKHSFSVYTKDFDITAAMEDIKSQLAGMYRPKPESMEPLSGPDPGPLRLDMGNQPGEFYESKFEPGAKPVADPHNIVKTGLRRDNDRLAPSGRRF